MTTSNSAATATGAQVCHDDRRDDVVSGHDAQLSELRSVGHRHAPLGRCGQALVRYWRFVVDARLEQRSAVFAELRRDIQAGRITPRASVPVALGDPDFELVRAATRTWLGSGPTSVERRAQAAGDAIDWVARGLASNRAAIFCALLDVADDALLERVAGLRGRLAVHEAAAVLAAHASAGEGLQAFCDEWRERLGELTASRPEPRAA